VGQKSDGFFKGGGGGFQKAASGCWLITDQKDRSTHHWSYSRLERLGAAGLEMKKDEEGDEPPVVHITTVEELAIFAPKVRFIDVKNPSLRGGPLSVFTSEIAERVSILFYGPCSLIARVLFLSSSKNSWCNAKRPSPSCVLPKRVSLLLLSLSSLHVFFLSRVVMMSRNNVNGSVGEIGFPGFGGSVGILRRLRSEGNLRDFLIRLNLVMGWEEFLPSFSSWENEVIPIRSLSVCRFWLKYLAFLDGFVGLFVTALLALRVVDGARIGRIDLDAGEKDEDNVITVEKVGYDKSNVYGRQQQIEKQFFRAYFLPVLFVFILVSSSIGVFVVLIPLAATLFLRCLVPFVSGWLVFMWFWGEVRFQRGRKRVRSNASFLLTEERSTTRGATSRCYRRYTVLMRLFQHCAQFLGKVVPELIVMGIMVLTMYPSVAELVRELGPGYSFLMSSSGSTAFYD